MYAYTGKILAIDLQSGKYEIEVIPDQIYENFLSGLGLGVYYLYKHIPPKCDPLGPENILGFVSGLLTGTGSLMTGRWMVVCKSPLTGGWGDANCGGTFSPAIKRCGYDAIFIRGKARKPVYLFIDDNTVEIKDAGNLWGKDAIESEELLMAEYSGKGRKPSVAVIGEAGERLSLISGISNANGRIAARSGVGAVMGSKNLKAVVLCGSRAIRAYDPEHMKEASKYFTQRLRAEKFNQIITSNLFPIMGKLLLGGSVTKRIPGILYAALLKKRGTNISDTLGMQAGDNPIKNWKGSVKDFNHRSYRHLDSDRITQREIRKFSCYSCAIGCGGICQFKDPDSGQIKETHKPEYESINALGGLLLNDDLDSIFMINDMLNRAGMDTISAGSTIAFALECYEHGILTKADTNGLELKWGDVTAIKTLIQWMIKREGIGDILADGSAIAAKKIGKGSEQYAIHAGGQEPGMHDSRLDPQLGLQYSIDPTPGRHSIGSGLYYNMMQLWRFSKSAPKLALLYPRSREFQATDENAQISVASSCIKMVLDGAGGCLFALISGLQNWQLFEYLNAATGWNKTPDDYLLIGKRIQTLRQMFNIRQGIDPKRNTLNLRALGTPPLQTGPLKNKSVPVHEMQKLHWKTFGWDEITGIPLDSTVSDLGLSNI